MGSLSVNRLIDRPEADESVVAVVVDLLAEEAARAVVAEVALERRAPPHHPQPHVVRARRAPATTRTTISACKTKTTSSNPASRYQTEMRKASMVCKTPSRRKAFKNF